MWVGIGLWWGSPSDELLELSRCDRGAFGKTPVVSDIGNNSTLCCEFESTKFGSVLMSENTKLWDQSCIKMSPCPDRDRAPSLGIAAGKTAWPA